ncbi:MAG TPA: PH domain-containing protein [Planctomycetota bacterium]|nr:PH domain-containing protein [Planctomycetota bacterium]
MEPNFDPRTIERPVPDLLKYYFAVSALTLLGFPAVFLPLYFKYHTLRFKFDDEGISVAWGILFHRETYLTYRRIQDIHVTRNLFHRWLGLAAVSIQTASGSSSAEMVIEGFPAPEKLRDYLYEKMRGARKEHDTPHEAGSAPPAARSGTEATRDEALVLLEEIRDEIRRIAAAGGRS